jgi:hypothetical protein
MPINSICSSFMYSIKVLWYRAHICTKLPTAMDPRDDPPAPPNSLGWPARGLILGTQAVEWAKYAL